MLCTQCVDGRDVAEAEKVKAIEKTTNHDVKAVEYYLKETALARADAARPCFPESRDSARDDAIKIFLLALHYSRPPYTPYTIIQPNTRSPALAGQIFVY